MEGAAGEPWLQMSALTQAKGLAALGSFSLAVAGCWAARELEQTKGRGDLREALLVVGNTVAAGILLAASLTHMLPDAIDALKELSDFPVAPTIAGSTFCFLVLLGEAVASFLPKREEPHTQTACVTYEASFAMWPRWSLMPPSGCDEADMHCRTGEQDPGAGEAGPGAAEESAANSGCCSRSHKAQAAALHRPSQEQQRMPAVEETDLVSNRGKHNHSHSSRCRVHRHSDIPCVTQVLDGRGRVIARALTEPLLLEAGALADNCKSCIDDPAVPGQVLVQPTVNSKLAPAAAKLSERPNESHDELVSRCHVLGVNGGPIAEIKSFLLFSALGFHSVMEGVGLGSVQGDKLLLPVMLAILAHKGLAAFALGCSLTKSDLAPWKFWTFVMIFALGTPVGCVAGMIFVKMASAAQQSVASGVCIAMASGTFLQVSSMELLPRSLAEEDHKVVGTCGLAVGFAAMSFLAIWA